MTSFGINTLIILNSPPDDNKIVLVERSKFLDNMEEQDKWHVSVNEALTFTDMQDDNIILELCVERGLNEELGIKNYRNIVTCNRYGDLFLLSDLFQVGITNLVRLNLNYCELELFYSGAKDSSLESVKMQTIDFNKKTIKKFIENNVITATCGYSLKMLLSRGKENIPSDGG